VPASEIPLTPTDPPDDPTDPPDDSVATFIAWIVGLGPGSPEGPTQVDVYKLIREGTLESCQLGRDEEMLGQIANEVTRTLYRGATSACLAALYGRVNRWDDVEEAFAALPGRPEACVDQAAYDLLESVVNAHSADPDAVFTREGEPPGGAPDRIRLPCPRVTLLTVTRTLVGYDVYVEGSRLDKVVHVAWDPVTSCPQPPDKEPPPDTRTDPVGDDQSITSTFTEQNGGDYDWMWIGLLAEPYPWVSAYECVEILDMQPV
jgi:hypothetical protein